MGSLSFVLGSRKRVGVGRIGSLLVVGGRGTGDVAGSARSKRLEAAPTKKS
jgi:hypothetical protein